MSKNKEKTPLQNDTKLAKSVLKEEKKELKKTKRLEKRKIKAEKKQRQAKLKEILKARRLKEKQIRRTQEETLRELEQRGKFASWFRLDNAASIYPSASDKDWNFVYRIGVTMKQQVNKTILQNAIDDILPRFPSFNVRLCHGFFWNYYERNFNRLKVEEEKKFPCQPFNLSDTTSFLIRVLYSKYRITLEVFHAITDGRGALFFMNSLIARYIELSDTAISDFKGCASYLDVPTDEEMEDSFFKNANSEKTKRPKERSAFKIKGTLLPAGMVSSTEGLLSVSKLKEVAKKYDATISVFLASVVGYCIYKKQKSNKKPTRISVPIDLRGRYQSKTLRNFSSYVNVEVAGDDLSFEDVIAIFKKELGNVDDKMLQANINANVKTQKNFFVKIIPLAIKNLVLKACFNYMGENYQTLALSNIGKVEHPKEFDDYVESYTFNLGRSMHNEKSIGVVSFNDTLSICISSKIAENETERDIFRMLSNFGIDIKVYSNRRDLYAAR